MADVDKVSADKTLITLGDFRYMQPPLPRDRLLQLVASEELEEAFRSCGAQGFNVAKLQPETAVKLSELMETEGGLPPVAASPLEDLIETKLEDYIVENWSHIDFGSRLRIYVEGNEPVGQQYDTGEIGRIDLLCEDEDTNDIVVIELKRGRPSDEVVGQLARYMGWARKRIANGRNVKGIVLAPDFDAKLRYAAEAIPGVDLYYYKIRFEIHRENIDTAGP